MEDYIVDVYDDNKKCKMNDDGDLFWYKGNLFHRDDGPTIEWADGSKEWHKDGKLHREDGPAVELANGYDLWFYEGNQVDCLSQEEFIRIIKLKAFW